MGKGEQGITSVYLPDLHRLGDIEMPRHEEGAMGQLHPVRAEQKKLIINAPLARQQTFQGILVRTMAGKPRPEWNHDSADVVRAIPNIYKFLHTRFTRPLLLASRHTLLFCAIPDYYRPLPNLFKRHHEITFEATSDYPAEHNGQQIKELVQHRYRTPSNYSTQDLS